MHYPETVLERADGEGVVWIETEPAHTARTERVSCGLRQNWHTPPVAPSDRNRHAPSRQNYAESKN